MKGQRRFGSLAALLLTTIAALLGPSSAWSQSQERMTLPGHVLPILSDRALTLPIAKAADAGTTPIKLTVVLRRNDESGLERLADRLNDPKSPEFRRWLTPEQVADRFGPSAQDFQTVEAWFRSEGFAIIERSSNRMTLTVSAPRSTIERSLGVTIATTRSSSQAETGPFTPIATIRACRST